ncbi:MAG: hypothetical protein EP329_12335 [Deltaproteobacteria bacterium]|nr:MAG: hypothetical protein EP329_12335 [Deltaproteobacteria bacterium]
MASWELCMDLRRRARSCEPRYDSNAIQTEQTGGPRACHRGRAPRAVGRGGSAGPTGISVGLDGAARPERLAAAPATDRDAIAIPVDATLAEAERILVSTRLERRGWRRGETAQALGIAPKTLYDKCRAWGLTPDE